jgi:hypothetical protein
MFRKRRKLPGAILPHINYALDPRAAQQREKLIRSLPGKANSAQ